MPVVLPLPVIAALVALGVVKYETVVKLITKTREAGNAVGNAMDNDLSVQFQLNQLAEEVKGNGILSQEQALRVIETAEKTMQPAVVVDTMDRAMQIIYNSLGPMGKKAAEKAIARTAETMQALLQALEYNVPRNLLGGPPLLTHPNTTYATSSTDLFFGMRGPTNSNYTSIGDAFVDSIVNPNSPFKSPDKYSSVFSPDTHARFAQIVSEGTNFTWNVWHTITNTAELTEWLTRDGWKWAAGVFIAYSFFKVAYRGRGTDAQKVMLEMQKTNAETQKAMLEMQKTNAETQKAMFETLKQTISREQRKSPRVIIKPLDDEEEEVKRPSTKSQEFIIKPFEDSDDEKMIPLLVDAFVTLAVSRALLFEIPQDPPQSIWAYAKSFVVNVVEPSFLVKMVCMEPEDADKLNPISRSFWPYYEKEWSKEERRRYNPLLNLKGLHVSAALKVKAVLDNSDHYDPKSLLGYIAKHRDQIKSGGLYQTLARFPLLLLEYFGDNLKTLESDIRERDRDIQRQDPIPDKPGIDEKVWKDPTIDLLFLFDASQMDANRIGNMLDWGTPLIREEMYWLSKHPRVLQDHLFRARLKHGIQSRVEVKTRDTTVVVFKPWISNESIWQVMENQASMMIKNERHTILHLRAAFLLAAADLENQIMEEHFDWKEGPFKRMMQPRHEAKWRGNSLGAPMIMPRSTMQAPWFADVSWFSSLVTCSSTRDMVQTMLKNPKNFPMFSNMTDGKEGDKIHALLNKRPVTVTFAKNSVAQQTHDVMQRMGQYSFARETGLDCFVYGQFELNGFAALAHYGQSKALHAYKEYATDASLCKVILSMGEAHRYGYLLNLKQESLRIDPGTKSVFVELFRASKDTSPDFQKLCSFDFQKLLSLWAAINPKTELANVLKTRSDVLESIKGCALSSPYETREGLMKMGPWLHALKNMHDENLYGFITPKLLQSGTYYGNKSAEIAPNIDHRGLVDTNKWSKKLDCRMLLKSMMLLSKYIEYGTWDANLPVWQDDIPTCGLNDEIEITIEMLIESRHQSLLFLDDLIYLQWYTQTTPKRESLFSYRFKKGDKIWKYDIKKQRLYEEIGKTLVNEMSIAKIRAATATKP